MLSDTQKIGAGLTGFGIFFMILGILMLLDAGLIAIGNILFISGVTLIIGPANTLVFFTRRAKIRGTIAFFLGFVLVVMKYPIWGVLVQAFGFINLFGDFMPTVVRVLRNIPIIGSFFNLPIISQIVDKLAGGQRLPV